MEMMLIAAIAGGLSWLAMFVLEKRQQGKAKQNRMRSGKIAKSADGLISRAETDYSTYRMSTQENILFLAGVSSVLMAVTYIFYKNAAVSLFSAPLSFVYLKARNKTLMERRKRMLTEQFRYAMTSLSSSLIAGKSVENAFHEALTDLKALFPHHDVCIIREISLISRRIGNGEPLENALSDFARRSAVDEIAHFTDVFNVCKRTGGDLVEVVRRTSRILNEKLEIQQNISAMLAQKRLEAKMLGMIPFGIIAFLSFSAPDYMEPLYAGTGRIVMTVALGALLFCRRLMHGMMKIEL